MLITFHFEKDRFWDSLNEKLAEIYESGQLFNYSVMSVYTNIIITDEEKVETDFGFVHMRLGVHMGENEAILELIE